MSLPPGPKRPAVLQSLAWARRPLRLLDNCRRRFGNPFTLTFVGNRRYVVYSDPESVKAIFTGSPDVYRAGKAQELLVRVLGKHCLLTLDGEDHRRHRRLLSSPLRGERLKVYAELTRDLALDDLVQWPVGRAVSAHERMTSVTLRLICAAVFGRGERADELGRLFAVMASKRNSLLGYVPALQVDLGPWSPWGKFIRLRDRFDELLFAEISAARAAPEGRMDVLAQVIAGSHEKNLPFTDEELRDELLTLLAAGHETTAAALAWNLAFILGTTAVRGRVQSELDQVVGDGPVGSEHLPMLTYLDAVVQETFRLRPPTIVAGRWLSQDVSLGGYDLPAGTYVYACNYLAHRDPETYPEPDRYLPDRHLGEQFGPFKLFPFGGGTRMCVGASLAQFQIKIVLAALLTRGRLRLAGAPDYTPHRDGLVVAPKDGVPIVYEGPV